MHIAHCQITYFKSRPGFSTEEKKWKHRRPYLNCFSILHNRKISFDFYGQHLSLGHSYLLKKFHYYNYLSQQSFFFFFKGFSYLFIYLFIYFWLCWVFGSREGFLQLRQAGATLHRGAGTALHRGARAFLYRGPSRRGAQAPDAQAQQLWLTGPAAPRHVGSSQTRARTRVPCTSRQTLNHCATREAPSRVSFQCLQMAMLFPGLPS